MVSQPEFWILMTIPAWCVMHFALEIWSYRRQAVPLRGRRRK